MQRLVLVLALAAFATACAKKQPAAGPKAPTNTTEPAKPGAAPDSANPPPAPVTGDPCMGGEKK
jgi:PBP1b-binding outer membrane lipoprotein LpoB